MGARLRGAAVLANNDVTVIVALHQRSRNSIQTNEAKPAEDALRAEVRGEEFFVAETVLQCEQRRALVQERRDKIDKVSV